MKIKFASFEQIKKNLYNVLQAVVFLFAIYMFLTLIFDIFCGSHPIRNMIFLAIAGVVIYILFYKEKEDDTYNPVIFYSPESFVSYVKHYSDLVNIPNKYNGMQVFVIEDETIYGYLSEENKWEIVHIRLK